MQMRSKANVINLPKWMSWVYFKTQKSVTMRCLLLILSLLYFTANYLLLYWRTIVHSSAILAAGFLTVRLCVSLLYVVSTVTLPPPEARSRTLFIVWRLTCESSIQYIIIPVNNLNVCETDMSTFCRQKVCMYTKFIQCRTFKT